MWFLAKELYEKTAFNLTNFNQIVKKELITLLKEKENKHINDKIQSSRQHGVNERVGLQPYKFSD